MVGSDQEATMLAIAQTVASRTVVNEMRNVEDGARRLTRSKEYLR